MLNRETSAGSRSVSWYWSPALTALMIRLPSGRYLPASLRLSARSITVWRISGRALLSSSRNKTIGFPSTGNQYGGMNSVLPLFSSLVGRPIRSPGSAICPRKRATTGIPFSLKNSVRISDLPIPWLPTSMMLCEAGVASRSCLSSVILTEILLISNLYLSFYLYSLDLMALRFRCHNLLRLLLIRKLLLSEPLRETRRLS